MQSTSHKPNRRRKSPSPLHVAMVLDGNGRWAEQRGWPRAEGYRAGVEAVRRVVGAAPSLGVGTLSLFALSADNWKRPAEDVDEILRLLTQYATNDARRLAELDVRLTFPGRRDRIPRSLAAALAEGERMTAGGHTLWVRIAVDYSARDIVVEAARRGGNAIRDRDAFRRALADAAGETETAPDVDLFIRTGGERRLSDFLLLESAYAELEFLELPWPEVTSAELAACIRRFWLRDRRFGALSRRPSRPVAVPISERSSSR